MIQTDSTTSPAAPVALAALSPAEKTLILALLAADRAGAAAEALRAAA